MSLTVLRAHSKITNIVTMLVTATKVSNSELLTLWVVTNIVTNIVIGTED